MLKTIIPIASVVFVLFVFSSCSTFKPAATKSHASSSTTTDGGVQFITNISTKPDGKAEKSDAAISPVSGKSARAPYADRSSAAIENYTALQFKYAILENASVEDLDNPKLLSFMDYWYGTPYHYGGTTKDGIDCSAFAFLLMSSVYGATLPRTSKEQYEISHHIRRDELQEGDLVFFHTLGKHNTVTHVGVYLRNNKFVHASVSGVMISDMNDGYYDRHFVGAGRVLDPSVAGGTMSSR